MEEYGHAQADWFKQFLALPHGILSSDTFRRVLSRLDPEELTRCFVNWTDSLRESADGEHRVSAYGSKGPSARHLGLIPRQSTPNIVAPRR